jgi:two-component system, cell cycle sensor histidine kinase and response regulator CckA
MSQPHKDATETILVVNESASVLAEVSLLLKNTGFTVLSASTPAEAIKLSADFDGSIDLLLTSVMMPGMSGPDLAKQLIKKRMKLRVMMMTGYDDGKLLVLNYGWQLVAKTAIGKVLREKVNAVLHSPDRSQGTDKFDTRKDVDN